MKTRFSFAALAASFLVVAQSIAQGFVNFGAALLMGPPQPPRRRARTCDVAFPYRMGAGFPGDVNRTHPASIEPAMMDTVDVVQAFGNPVLYKTSNNSYKGFVAADSTTPVIVAGFAVRPYPTQQVSGGATASIGGGAPAAGVIDVLTSGYIMAKLPPGASVTKGGAVYVWFAATSGNNIQGGLVASATGGSTALITNAKFNGPADANGNVEVRVWSQG